MASRLMSQKGFHSVGYSAAQICPNQNICVIRVSPIRVYAYAYMHIQYAYTVYTCMPH